LDFPGLSALNDAGGGYLTTMFVYAELGIQRGPILKVENRGLKVK
jgi:hypothetical protein